MARPKVELAATDIDYISKMAAAGLTLDQMSAMLSISPKTLDRRMVDTPGVKEAIEKGRAQALYNVAVSAYSQAVSGKVPAMTMFYLKCRGGWKETHVTEVTGKDGESLFTSFTDMVKRLKEDGK